MYRERRRVFGSLSKVDSCQVRQNATIAFCFSAKPSNKSRVPKAKIMDTVSLLSRQDIHVQVRFIAADTKTIAPSAMIQIQK